MGEDGPDHQFGVVTDGKSVADAVIILARATVELAVGFLLSLISVVSLHCYMVFFKNVLPTK